MVRRFSEGPNPLTIPVSTPFDPSPKVMDPIILLSLITGTVTIFYALLLISQILRNSPGDKKMGEVADAIREGAQAYLGRQNKTVAVVAVLLAGLLWARLGQNAALGFLLGAVASTLAGYIGMMVAVRSNVRVTQAAKSGLGQALSIAFKGGSVTGLMVGGLAILSIAGILGASEVYNFSPITPLIALSFGGSLISVFARLGGGIFTKGADVGTDIVGKVEAGIPEDDPRNPGVIADLVGDNVGDDAGMAADIFETYVVTAIAAIILGQLLMPFYANALLFPLVILAVAVFASVAGSFFVRLSGKNIMGALYKGLIATVILCAILFYPVTLSLMADNGLYSVMNLYLASLIGILVTAGMVVITEYYTGTQFSPVKHIAESSSTGHGTNVIAGLAVSMKSTFAPVILI